HKYNHDYFKDILYSSDRKANEIKINFDVYVYIHYNNINYKSIAEDVYKCALITNNFKFVDFFVYVGIQDPYAEAFYVCKFGHVERLNNYNFFNDEIIEPFIKVAFKNN